MKIRTLKQLGLDERISSSTGIEHLEQLRRNWSKVPMFLNTGDLDIARKLVGTTLWHTYLFGGVTVPRYAEHVFGSITTPQDDVDGGILANTMRFIAEEICTNNVFEGDGESHSHYFDLRRAYGQAQASLDKVAEFESAVKSKGFEQATIESPLWGKEMVAYARTLKEATRDPLTSFLIATVSEDSIPEGYKTILKHLSKDPSFAYFRTFMQRHIQLDQKKGGHGSVTVDWLNNYVRNNNPSTRSIELAVEKTNDFITRRIETYR